MQAMAGPALPPHGHRRHHARHGKRACRAKSPHSAAGQGYGAGNGNGTVPIYISESAISMESASASQIGSEHAATGKSLSLSSEWNKLIDRCEQRCFYFTYNVVDQP
jgi:hypothetical protein